MNGQLSRTSLAERLIAAGRLVLAAPSLLAVWLGRAEPATGALTAGAVLTAYVVYALLAALVVWRVPAVPARWPLITHAVDLGVFFLLMSVTEGPASPFFLYLVFALLCGTLRWRWCGTSWTAVAGLAMVAGLEVLKGPEFQPSRFLLRSVSLAGMAALLAGFAIYEQRTRSDLSKLVAWPHSIPENAQALVRTLLEHAAGILGAPRVVMAWEEPEEPWLHLASWSRGEFEWTRESPEKFEPLVAAPLAVTNFLCRDAGAPIPTVLHASASGVRRWHGAPVNAELQARFGIEAVLGLSLHGEIVTGRLFCLDNPAMSGDVLAASEIVASQVAARLNLFYLVERLRHAAATDERVRLSRDLHDGPLQSLAGTALQLQTVRRLLDEAPQTARDRLEEVQQVIGAQQRALRAFIRHLRPLPLGALQAGSSLVAAFGELASRVECQWDVRVDVKIGRLETHVPEALLRETSHMLHEALVNAARHGHASSVNVDVSADAGRLQITVADDGRGFPFHGRYDHATLTELGLGPATLKERVASLGGSLAINSNTTGARLEIRLPLPWPGA